MVIGAPWLGYVAGAGLVAAGVVLLLWVRRVGERRRRHARVAARRVEFRRGAAPVGWPTLGVRPGTACRGGRLCRAGAAGDTVLMPVVRDGHDV